MVVHPSRTVFVFDLHDVIVKKNYARMFSHALKKAYRLDLLFIALNPRFMYHIIQLFKTSRVPEQYVVELAQTWPKLSPFIEVVITMMNEQRPIDRTVKIIETLKRNGYKLYMFSNIGEQTLQQLQKKLPTLFNYFDGIVCVEQQDDWIQKPSGQAFEKFLTTFNLQSSECIFIDNSKKNIASAATHGFHGILYTSPQKLFDELTALHALS